MSAPEEEIEFDFLGEIFGSSLWSCKECGAVVSNVTTHTKWHEKTTEQLACDTHTWGDIVTVPNKWDPEDILPSRTCVKCGYVEVNIGFPLFKNEWISKEEYDAP